RWGGLTVDSLVLQTAIGLVFIFGITAAAVSAVTEAVSRFVGLRAEYLLRGVRTMVDGQSDFRLSWRSVMPKMLGGRPQPAADGPARSHQSRQERDRQRGGPSARPARLGADGGGADTRGRFWFDVLSRLGTLRSTGPRPST
ncbi:MAG TPA: hypothetical protein VKD66_12910, partial [Streptosporangiaceae bacterium]|nr:hypothetical protein [Streptosporangiaceae bacterium]